MSALDVDVDLDGSGAMLDFVTVSTECNQIFLVVTRVLPALMVHLKCQRIVELALFTFQPAPSQDSVNKSHRSVGGCSGNHLIEDGSATARTKYSQVTIHCLLTSDDFTTKLAWGSDYALAGAILGCLVGVSLKFFPAGFTGRLNDRSAIGTCLRAENLTQAFSTIVSAKRTAADRARIHASRIGDVQCH